MLHAQVNIPARSHGRFQFAVSPSDFVVPRPTRARNRKESILFLLGLGLACYGSVAMAVFGWYSLGHPPIRSSKDAPSIAPALVAKTFSTGSKEILLRHANAVRARESSAQIRYIANIILHTNANDMVERDARAMAEAIVTESRAAELDPLFVAAVIKTESTFKKHAVSHSGATGLMQIKFDTGRYISERASLDWNGFNSLKDPVANVKLGIAYLKQLKNSFQGNVEQALIAYNWGPTNLNHALKERSPIPASTVRYAKGVLYDQKKWQHEYAFTRVAVEISDQRRSARVARSFWNSRDSFILALGARLVELLSTVAHVFIDPKLSWYLPQSHSCFFSCRSR